LGIDQETVHRAVQGAQRGGGGGHRGRTRPAAEDRRRADAPAMDHRSGGFERPDARDPAARLEKEALEVVLQQPTLLSAEQWPAFYAADFKVPAFAVVHSGIRAAGMAGATPAQWVEQVRQEVPAELAPLVGELAVTPLPARTEDDLIRYCRDIMNRLFELQITHQKADLMGRLQRMGPDGDPAEFAALNRQLFDLEMKRR